MSCALLIVSCTEPTENVAASCGNAGALLPPATVVRDFDPDGCTLLNLEDRPFTGSEATGTIRYDRFTVTVPPGKTIGFAWGEPQLPGLQLRIYDSGGHVVDLNGIGWYFGNPGATPLTYQVLVTEAAGRVEGRYELVVSQMDHADLPVGTYALQTVDGASLPARVFHTSTLVDVVKSTLTLRADGTWEEVRVHQYSGFQRPTTTETVTYRGTYARGSESLALRRELDEPTHTGELPDANTVVLHDWPSYRKEDWMFVREQ